MCSATSAGTSPTASHSMPAPVTTGSARISLTARDSNGTSNCDRRNGPLVPIACIPNAAFVDETWSAPTGGVGITYHFTDDDFVYGKYTRGWKGGHIQANATRLVFRRAAPAHRSHADGRRSRDDRLVRDRARGRWFDDRLQLGGNLFYYKYTDYQVFVIDNQLGTAPSLKIINANDARVYGAEADFRLAAVAGLRARPARGPGAQRALRLDRERVPRLHRHPHHRIPGRATPPADSCSAPPWTSPGTGCPTRRASRSAAPWSTASIWGAGARRRFATTSNWTDDIFFDPTEGTRHRRRSRSSADHADPVAGLLRSGSAPTCTHDLRARLPLPRLHDRDRRLGAEPHERGLQDLRRGYVGLFFAIAAAT